MPNITIHLLPFLEIVAAVVAVPVAGFYVLRGRRRRRIEDVQIPRVAALARHDSEPPLGVTVLIDSHIES